MEKHFEIETEMKMVSDIRPQIFCVYLDLTFKMEIETVFKTVLLGVVAHAPERWGCHLKKQ